MSDYYHEEEEEKNEKPDPIEEITKWANQHLAKYGESITDLTHDFCDGVKLIHVVNSVCKCRLKVNYPHPKNVFQKRNNIQTALRYLENNMIIQPGKIKRDDILWGEIMPVFNCLRVVNYRVDNQRCPPLPYQRVKRTSPPKTTQAGRKKIGELGYDSNGRKKKQTDDDEDARVAATYGHQSAEQETDEDKERRRSFSRSSGLSPEERNGNGDESGKLGGLGEDQFGKDNGGSENGKSGGGALKQLSEITNNLDENGSQNGNTNGGESSEADNQNFSKTLGLAQDDLQSGNGEGNENGGDGQENGGEGGMLSSIMGKANALFDEDDEAGKSGAEGTEGVEGSGTGDGTGSQNGTKKGKSNIKSSTIKPSSDFNDVDMGAAHKTTSGMLKDGKGAYRSSNIHDSKKEEPKSQYAVGIDLGTSFCRYGIFKDDDDVSGSKSNEIQSAVCFTGDDRSIGCIPLTAIDDENAVIITAIKRIIGRDFTDPTLREEIKNLPYPVEEDSETHRPVITVPVNGQQQKISPEQITSMLLSHIKQMVSEETGENVVDAVISVPAFFSNAQRQATKDAGTLAGLNVLRIVNEPAAAAMSVNSKQKDDNLNHVVVFDMGGGKLDVALMDLQGGVCTTVKTAGNTQLGGMDFDRKLAMKFVEEFKKQSGSDITNNIIAMRRMIDACENAKTTLSTQDSAEIKLKDLDGKGNDFNRVLTREEFDSICKDLYESAMKPVEEVFTDSEISKDQLTRVILVGGSSKIPKMRETLAQYFGPDVELFDADQNEAVVVGAAMQGAIMKGNNTGVLSGVEMRNNTSLSLGISLANGANNIIIPRGTNLPAKLSTLSTTSRDNQTNVGFDVVEGERPMAADNIKLGHVMIEGIQIAKRGVPRIEITMEINEDGILIVSGKDLTTGAAVTAKIENKGNLSPEDIDRMIAEAEAMKAEDQRKCSIAESRTDLQFYIERTERNLNDPEKTGKMSPENKSKCLKQIETAKLWLEAHTDDDPEVYDKKQQDLRAFFDKM